MFLAQDAEVGKGKFKIQNSKLEFGFGLELRHKIFNNLSN
jgi:hypothetical protein